MDFITKAIETLFQYILTISSLKEAYPRKKIKHCKKYVRKLHLKRPSKKNN